MKLIASDFDGTFNVGSVEERRKAVEAWQAAGNKIGIISGRAPADLPRLLDGLGIRCDFLASASGAVISDGKGNILRERHCSGEMIRPLLDELFAGKCVYCNIVADQVYTVYAAGEETQRSHISYEDAVKLPYFHQVSAYHLDEQSAADSARLLKKRLGDQVNPLQNGRFLDIVPGNLDKAEGIRQLISLWGVAPEDVITVGDNYNDLAMIEAFPSYAIESGVEALKEASGRVVPDVAELIYRELQK